MLSDAGIATLLEAKTGKQIWSERLGSRLHHASPLLVNGLIYCLADDGTMFVLKAGAEFEVVAKNALGEECHATPGRVGRPAVHPLHRRTCGASARKRAERVGGRP